MSGRRFRRNSRDFGRVFLAVFTIVLGLIMPLPKRAGAMETFPEEALKGSLTVTIKDSSGQQPVQGGEFRLYQVAEVNRDGGLRFIYKEGFQEASREVELSGLTLKDSDKLGTRKYADTLMRLADQIPADRTATLSSEGRFILTNLDQGIFLVVQREPAKGYEIVKPFVLTIPWYDTEKMTWELDVTSSPKLGIAIQEQEVLPPVSPNITDSTLPLTGQIWWPVPVLGILGLVLALVGLVRRRREVL